MAFKRKQRVVMRHPGTIVDHADHALAALLDFDANGVRAGVNGVFEQLFHHRCGPLDNFPRGDFIRHRLRQYSDSAHLDCELADARCELCNCSNSC